MHEYGVLTNKTPIVYAHKKNDSIATMPYLPDIYHKSFDVTEFIGERLATIQGVRTNHYFPVCFDKYDPRVKEKHNFSRRNIRVGSYDFMESDVLYLTASELPSYFEGDSFEFLLGLCKDNGNREEFIEENLKLFGLDIYMCQRDRCGNGYYEFRSDGEVHFAPVFDYQESLDKMITSDMSYKSDFFEFMDIEDYQEMMEKYPRFREILTSYLDIELDKEIMAMVRDRCFDLDGIDLISYRRFDYLSHKRLEKILK